MKQNYFKIRVFRFRQNLVNDENLRQKRKWFVLEEDVDVELLLQQENCYLHIIWRDNVTNVKNVTYHFNLAGKGFANYKSMQHMVCCLRYATYRMHKTGQLKTIAYGQ